ncbi:MAG: alpha/beta hydrolase [Chloroflexota bacterium]
MTEHKLSVVKQSGIESLRLKVEGHEAHYLKTGSGPPVVLFHGGASDSRDWLPVMSLLCQRYSLYAPDILGYGLSEKDSCGYHISDFIDFSVGFIQALGLECPVVAGHSLGGRICLDIALHHPVRGLVLVDTAGFGRITPWGSLLNVSAWVVRRVLGRPQPYPKFLPDDGQDARWLCLERLPELRVPTLIVWQRFDPYMPLATAIRASQLIPGALLAVLPGYGHAPHKKDVRAFSQILAGFLDGSDAGATGTR